MTTVRCNGREPQVLIVVGLAAAGVVALVLAVVTGSTIAAVAVVLLAVAGIVLLLRDWRAERSRAAGAPIGANGEADEQSAVREPLTPDEFAPDISTDPGGPSSDARAD